VRCRLGLAPTPRNVRPVWPQLLYCCTIPRDSCQFVTASVASSITIAMHMHNHNHTISMIAWHRRDEPLVILVRIASREVEKMHER